MDNVKSIRPFIGAADFETSQRFYRELGFKEIELANGFSVFKTGNFAFYLQDAYVKDWIDNTMVFMEIENVPAFYQQLKALNLPEKFPGVRVLPVHEMEWGRECFLHDPSGILWHFGEFY
ncbi:glyoxalase [Flavobacterium longum]|uniref:glyoxalase n=1 Tax=Flavobacterium longum TaxID=1299340 RepID=UPI0039EA8024